MSRFLKRHNDRQKYGYYSQVVCHFFGAGMQSSTPISLMGTTSQTTLLVLRIPADELTPHCQIVCEMVVSRNPGGASAVVYGLYLNDALVTAVGKGELIVSTTSMAATGQNCRREQSVITIGPDLRQQKFAQNNATAGGFGNLNKIVDANFNGLNGLALVVAATLGNAADVFTLESYRVGVTR